MYKVADGGSSLGLMWGNNDQILESGKFGLVRRVCVCVEGQLFLLDETLFKVRVNAKVAQKVPN